jgi:hypothetical protein
MLMPIEALRSAVDASPTGDGSISDPAPEGEGAAKGA